jgi:hypothetical protein
MVAEINITDFHRVRIEGACAAEILRSDTYGIVIPEEAYGYIKARKEGDTLVIGRKGFASIFFSNRPRAVITMPELYDLVMTGASHGKVIGFHTDLDLSVELNGASHLEMVSMAAGNTRIKTTGASHLNGEINVRYIHFEISGASWVELTGSGDSARIDISGASQAKLANFALNSSDVKVSGASSTSLKVNQKLDLKLEGASRLEYTGSPALGRVSVSGASTLKQR